MVPGPVSAIYLWDCLIVVSVVVVRRVMGTIEIEIWVHINEHIEGAEVVVTIFLTSVFKTYKLRHRLTNRSFVPLDL